MSLRYLALAIAVGCFRSAAQAQTLPYVSTSILLPETNTVSLQQNVSTNLAYIFSSTGNTVKLFTLDISGTFDASSLPLNPVSTSLPFLGDSSTAFAPSLSDNGSLIVYAGDCSSSDKTSVWTLNPATGSGSVSWSQAKTTTSSRNNAKEMGPGFLGGSLSFSTTLAPTMSKASVYVYGGMCPNASSNATSDQSRATYSNKMVKLTQAMEAARGYDVSMIEDQGPPVPEAGFTFTGLSASISNRSGTVTQQANYVLLGGHTETAFINMSTVAIWSLPEESWAFVTNVGMASSGTTGTELRASAASVDSRSGHTAVLNADGTAIVVYGGWVGDLSQAASPQLAVLQLGAGYGGAARWQWSIPEKQPTSAPMYGHGAALLPGNVMMIYGGQKIATSSGSKHRRQSTSNTNSAMFLNLTSMEWAPSYTNPSYTGSNIGQTGSGSTSTSDDTKKKLGLGLGLGLGLAAIIAALLIYLWYRRRLQHRRTIRNSALQALAQDQTRYIHDINGDMIERPEGTFAWYTGGSARGYETESRSLGYESLRGARASMDAGRETWWEETSPPQIRRKPVAALAGRGQYQQAPTAYEQTPPPARGSRNIHPIAEADEDGSLHDADIASYRRSLGHEPHGDHDYSDPFMTPVRESAHALPPPNQGARTPSPERVGPVTDPDVQDWMTDVDTADALLSGRMVPRAVVAGAGRTSPTRRATVRSNRSIGQYFGGDDDSRTGSNISESNRSNLSGGSGSIRLRPSPGFGVAMTAAAAAVVEGRGDTAGSGNSNSSISTPSYNTARTSFHALQTEGPSLLHSGNRDPDYDDTPGSPSKSKPPRRGWLGSLRRVFSGSGTVPSPAGSDRNDSPTRDMYAETNDYEARRGGLGEIAAGGLLRRKGGRGAWVDGNGRERAASLGMADYGGGYQQAAGQDDDEDWDIEKEVEKRLVQVMFTVPKERLRVVNAEPDLDGESAVFVEPPDEKSSIGVAIAGPSDSGKETQARPVTPNLQHPPTPPRTTSPYEKDRGLPSIPTRIFTPESDDAEDRTFSFQKGVRDEVSSRKGGLNAPSTSAAGQPSGQPKKEQRRFSFQPEGTLSVPTETPDRPGHIAFVDKGKGRARGDSDSSEQSVEGEGARLIALEHEIDLLGKELESHQRRGSGRPLSGISTGMMSDGDNYSDAEFLSAEAVQVVRPAVKTKVLQMVESFESLTRAPSPAGSATR